MILGIVLYLIPIITIVFVSNEEMKQYQMKQIEFVDTAYGEVFQVEQKNIRENIMINAVAASNDIAVIHGEGDDTVWIVNEGEEVKKDQVIGYRKSEPIKGQMNGIVKEITSNYILLNTYRDIVWETEVLEKNLHYFKRQLYDKYKNKVQVCFISNRIVEGKATVKFQLKNVKGKCGQQLKKIKLYTNKEFRNVLTINKKCVVNRDGNYYVRIVDEQGIFQYEQQVNVGFENDDIICVTGIEEGTFCDGGFAGYIGTDFE